MRARAAEVSSAHFTPYFDFGVEADSASTTEACARATELLREVCREWTRQGNRIDVCGFGVTTRGVVRDCDTYSPTYNRILNPGRYVAIGEICDPLGALLAGQRSTLMPVLDAARVLKVDEFYVVGFIHGFDSKGASSLVGKNLDKLEMNPAYHAGRDAGWEMRHRFVKPELGVG